MSGWGSRPYCAFRYDPRGRIMRSRRNLWDGALFAMGAHGRRHERRFVAWIRGWNAEQALVESDEPAECPYAKARYVNCWGAGRKAWRYAIGGGK